MTIHGWDASHYDWTRGPVDVDAAVRDGMTFVTHKVSEGNSYVDPKFASFAARARAHSGRVLLGGYCVNRRGDQRPQVDNYIRCLDQSAPWWRDGDWLVQLDCERWSNKDGVYAYEPRLYEIREWCSYFMARTGSRWKPIVYAPKWTYSDQLRGLEYPLWASNYGGNPGVPYRQAYPGDTSSRWAAYSGQTPAVLQYGSRTTIGSQGTCDANAYRGSLAELVALTRGPAAKPALPTIEEDTMFLSKGAGGEIYTSTDDLMRRRLFAPSINHDNVQMHLPFLVGRGVAKVWKPAEASPDNYAITPAGFGVWNTSGDMFGALVDQPLDIAAIAEALGAELAAQLPAGTLTGPAVKAIVEGVIHNTKLTLPAGTALLSPK